MSFIFSFRIHELGVLNGDENRVSRAPSKFRRIQIMLSRVWSVNACDRIFAALTDLTIAYCIEYVVVVAVTSSIVANFRAVVYLKKTLVYCLLFSLV